MRGATVMILHALLMQAATTLAAESTDQEADSKVDALMDRSLSASTIDGSLDDTTLAKTASLRQAGMRQPQVQASAMRSSGGFCPVPQKLGKEWVSKAQSDLRKYGVPASPWEELALTAFAATRDVSMRAEAKRVMASMEKRIQSKTIDMTDDEAEELKKTMAGQTAPLGYWDPAGFSKTVNAGTLLFYREAEIKHGRVCMLAFLGILVGEKFHPLAGDIMVPASSGGLLFDPSYAALTPNFMATIAIALAVELSLRDTVPNWLFRFAPYTTPDDKYDLNRIPGDLGFDPLGLKPKTATELKELQDKEINNGRLAMLAVVGMVGQEAFGVSPEGSFR